MPAQKLVILDGYTLNPGDLSWDEFQNILPEVEIHERTAPDEVLARCAGASIVLTNKTRLPAEVIQALPGLKFIGVLATGFDVVDAKAARACGIPVSNVPAYSTFSVVQMVFGFILNWTNGIAHHADRVREGAWAASKDFAFWDFPLHELEGKTLGIVGFGRIGQQVGKIANAFGMKVAAVVRSPKSVDYPVAFVTMEEIFSDSDFVCLLCPLTPETRGLANSARIRTMKKTAYLINTARGPVVVEEDLAAALNEGMIAGAAADVLSAEPPPASNPLLTAKNMVITPHFAWATVEARQRLMNVSLANVRAFLEGSPKNVVN
ncbi:MAG: D-2-hydroxyacid dehydrogenase [Terrimicrobiaceae bacterium]